MKPTASCADDFDPDSRTCAEATAQVLASVTPVAVCERVGIRAALGRVLAADVHAAFDVPAHTNSAIDGYAVIGADIPEEGAVTLRLVGTALAGHPYTARVARGECVRIMTGAPMPAGTDTALFQERVTCTDAEVRIVPGERTGANVRLAGEDIARGQCVLAAGRRLLPADIGLLASLGLPEVSVRRRLRVAFFSTGDELRSLGEPLGPGLIYDSNRYTLHGMLSRLDCELVDMGVVGDDPGALEAAFRAAGDCADAVISSGGVSVGEADYVKSMLSRVGRVEFWKIAMKPGRPLAFGHVGGAVFFGLPGNPVSVMVTFYQMVLPALRRMSGEADALPLVLKARTRSILPKRPGRTEFQRGVLRCEGAELVVDKTGDQGSGILSSMAEANCFIVLPLESGRVEAGSLVDVQPFAGLV